MAWMKYGGKILKEDGGIVVDEECCCGTPPPPPSSCCCYQFDTNPAVNVPTLAIDISGAVAGAGTIDFVEEPDTCANWEGNILVEAPNPNECAIGSYDVTISCPEDGTSPYDLLLDLVPDSCDPFYAVEPITATCGPPSLLVIWRVYQEGSDPNCDCGWVEIEMTIPVGGAYASLMPTFSPLDLLAGSQPREQPSTPSQPPTPTDDLPPDIDEWLS